MRFADGLACTGTCLKRSLPSIHFKRIQWRYLQHVLPPTFKTAVYGLIIGLIACFEGMRTRGGAAGVGRAATNSVVLASLFLILADVVLVKFILVFFINLTDT